MFLTSQPLESLHGLIGAGAMATTRRFDGDGVFGQELLVPVPVAGRGDSDTFSHGIKLDMLTEFVLELLAPGFQQFDM